MDSRFDYNFWRTPIVQRMRQAGSAGDWAILQGRFYGTSYDDYSVKIEESWCDLQNEELNPTPWTNGNNGYIKVSIFMKDNPPPPPF